MKPKQIVEKYKDCKKCENSLNDTKIFGQGNLSAKIAVVGEGPGKDEVAELTPFVGAAGQLLDKILSAIDLKREDLFFTNAVLCRTAENNRKPTKQECLNCKQRLFEELSIVKPRFTLLVGATALETILGKEYKISETHGQWFTWLTAPCYFYFSIYHPAWILHSVTEGEKKLKKRTMWEDVKKFREGVDNIGSIMNWGLIENEIKKLCKMQKVPPTK